MSIFALDRRPMNANLALQTISSTGIDCVEDFGGSDIEAEFVAISLNCWPNVTCIFLRFLCNL